MDIRWTLLCRLACSCFALAVFSGSSGLGSVNGQDTDKAEQLRTSEDTPNEKKEDEKIPTVAEKAAKWTKFEGFQSFWWDADHGTIWLEISEWNREFLFVHSMSTGLGSNPIGLDRGQLGQEYVCRFDRVGRKVLLVAQNLRFRALTDNVHEQRAVEESFASSVLWGGTVGAETDGTVLIDVTELMMRDMHDVSATLKRSEQGDFSIDATRSSIYMDRTKAFPKNTELESTLTFAGTEPGELVRGVAIAPKSITLRQHLSFIELPDADYTPRLHDPRCPSMFVSFADYSSPIDQPLQKRWIIRHRLQKKDPEATISEPIEPIIYYVDSGAPQPIRDALIEGASWWNTAFESAGFKNAFQVRVLPDGADPMDVRYNVIQWVHRSTRGWSYGGSVVDPRTGEIIKGHVSLGSLRVRQDRMLLDGLTIPQTNAACSCCGIAGIVEDAMLATLAEDADPSEVALARIRQLSAHEVGHTLGLVHNFAASTYADRASVMDYPAPRIKLTENNQIDLSDAYGVGVGVWDDWSVQFAYQQFAEGIDETGPLAELVNRAIREGYLFMSDGDSRPAGAAHPLANLWDNGSSPSDELAHLMKVRRIALQQLGEHNLSTGQPVADLADVLVPIYLLHRYQVDAASKLIGGAYYTYAIKDDGQIPIRAVSAAEQLRALDSLLVTIDPTELTIPESILNRLAPQPYSSYRDIELFSGQTTPVFDSLGAARVSIDMTIGNLLQVERVSRLALQSNSGFDELMLINKLVETAWNSGNDEPGLNQIRRVVKQGLFDHLVSLAEHPQASIEARAAAQHGLSLVSKDLQKTVNSTDLRESTFATQMWAELQRFRNRPYATARPADSLTAPPGSPIGGK